MATSVVPESFQAVDNINRIVTLLAYLEIAEDVVTDVLKVFNGVGLKETAVFREAGLLLQYHKCFNEAVGKQAMRLVERLFHSITEDNQRVLSYQDILNYLTDIAYDCGEIFGEETCILHLLQERKMLPLLLNYYANLTDYIKDLITDGGMNWNFYRFSEDVRSYATLLHWLTGPPNGENRKQIT